MDSAPNGSSLSRKELQTCLKAWHRKATGTTVALRAEYEDAVRQNPELASTTATATTATAATTTAMAETKTTTKASMKAATKDPPAEKRIRRYRSQPTMGIRQRIERARTQRLYLVKQESDVPRKRRTFVVLGSTGNVYDITVAQTPHCSCPDHAKGHLCKHILFVMLKVIGLPSDSPLVYQDAYLQSELDELSDLLESRRVGGAVMANANVQKTYASLQSSDANDEDACQEVQGAQRKSLEADCDCPICFDAMTEGTSLTYCRAACGTNFHSDCIQRWVGQSRGNPTCPNCRQPWEEADAKKNKKEEGYTNLGALQGQARKRDTSTYSSPSYYKRYRRW